MLSARQWLGSTATLTTIGATRPAFATNPDVVVTGAWTSGQRAGREAVAVSR
jgi:hypothetical protein